MLPVLLRFAKQTYTTVLILVMAFGSDAYAQPLKIMPLGNSITQGSDRYVSYRYELWKMLLDAEVNFEFVGSQNLNWNNDSKTEVSSPKTNETYKGQTFTNLHEGHWGWRTDEILNGRGGPALREWVKTYKPDIILLHLGTNDLFQKQTIESTISEIRQVVEVIREESPSATIFIAQLIPADKEDIYLKDLSEQIPNFNREIPALVAALNDDNSYPNSKVILVDQNTGFNATRNYNSVEGLGDTYDGLHPNSLGEAKMAQRWFEAIMDNMEIIPLPVELHSFKGRANKNAVSLSWTTASEQDNHYFEVQRSQDPKNFKAIGRVEGAGTTSLTQHYTFEDKEAPAGTNYYRLRQVDFDGTESFSAIVAVSMGRGETEDMRVYPTRTQGNRVTLQMVALQPNEKFSVGIYTLEGKLVKSFEAETDSRGNYTGSINPSDLKEASLYMVRATLAHRVFLRHLLVDL